MNSQEAFSRHGAGRDNQPWPACFWEGPKLMSVAHQFAQAVLGLALLGHVVRLFVVAASDHEPTSTPSRRQPARPALARGGSATSAAAGAARRRRAA